MAKSLRPKDRSDFSIFLSHASDDADLVKAISSALPDEGLRGFVATYHIVPTHEWLPELENELRGCDALVAVLSPAFRSSSWTDQEVGYALAAGRKVIPLQTSDASLPHGFLQRFQGLLIGDLSARQIAKRLFDLLYAHPDERPRLGDVVLAKLESERNQTRLSTWVRRLDQLNDLDNDRRRRLEHALAVNAVIRNNARMAGRMRAAIDRCTP